MVPDRDLKLTAVSFFNFSHVKVQASRVIKHFDMHVVSRKLQGLGHNADLLAALEKIKAIDSAHVGKLIRSTCVKDDLIIECEFVSGRSLREAHEHHKAFIFEAICQLLTGLEDFARVGVVHNDVRPDNLILTDEGYICLIDFDRIALSGEKATRSTCYGYSSPEQLEQNVVDWRSDLFGAGVVMCELLSGVSPYPGKDILSRTYSVTAGEMRRPKSISDEEWYAIQKMCAFEPNQRFSSLSLARACILELTVV